MAPKTDDAGAIVGYVFHCPGCDHGHIYYTKSFQTKNGPTATWDFNGDLENPTFTPSLLNTCDDHPDPKQRRCHLNVTAGMIQFHGDCAHDLAGRLVDLDTRPERWA